MVREWRRVSLRALVDDKAVRLLCGGSLLHSHPLARDCRHQAASCSKTRRFTTRPPPSSLHSALSSPLHSLVSGACCVAPVLSLSLRVLHFSPFRGYSRYAFSSMYSTNATAIKRSPLRSTGREEKEREREREKGRM